MSKLRISQILLLFLLSTCSICSGTPFNENKVVKIKGASSNRGYPTSGVINAGASLRLRQWPWGKVKSLHADGSKVTVLGMKGEFYKVKVNGATGYMHKNYITTPNKPASRKEPAYPSNTRKGGYIPRPSAKSIAKKSSRGNGKTRYVHKNYVSTSRKAASQKLQKKPSKSKKTTKSSTYKASVIGKSFGDGTRDGALTWAADQKASGKRRGYNSNTGQTSRNSKCWSGWCLAFIGTAWGRKIPELRAPSAIRSYYNFKRAGKIKTNRNPPAGAVMFTDKTSTNPYGHIFMATGKKSSSGEPIVISNTGSGIKEFTLSQMIGRTRYLGWALPR